MKNRARFEVVFKKKRFINFMYTIRLLLHVCRRTTRKSIYHEFL